MAGPTQNQHKHSATQLASENTNPRLNKPFWHEVAIDALKWNKSYPFQLLVLRKTSGGSYVTDETWKFTLPIPPQSLGVDMVFAMDDQMTLGGVIEQNSGARKRMISLSGTTGVLPLRGSAPAVRQFNLAEAVFAGTIQQAKTVITAANDLKNDLNPRTEPSNLLKTQDINAHNDVGKTTGYYQFEMLQSFLENYAHLKTTDAGKDRRLALAIWKSNAVYLVTPKTFSLRRQVPDVYEYPWALSLSAWRRISLDKIPPAEHLLTPIVRNPDKLARALKTIDDSRRILHGARDVLYAITGDLAHAVLEPLREISLFIKDALGTVVAMADLPQEVIRSAKAAVIEAISVRDASSALPEQLRQSTDQTNKDYQELLALAQTLSKGDTGAGDLQQTLSGASSSPAHSIFDDAEGHYDFFSLVKPGDLNLSPGTIAAIQAERERAQQLGRADFESIRNALRTASDQISDAVGRGDRIYDRIYDRASGSAVREATDDDFAVLFALNAVSIELDHLAASSDTDLSNITTMEVVAGMASRSGIAFRVPASKFAVPFPYGTTLERLAARYLGDPDRWMEIATLNGLRAPYVDEEGFDLPLISNSTGRSVAVADASRLRPGQAVSLYSRTVPRLSRVVSRIDRISSSLSMVTLDKDVPLLRLGDGAQLHGYLPDTVNSRQMIYIPSSIEAPDEDYHTKGIPGLNEFDPLLRVAGMDLLLTPDGDLVLTPDGDTPISSGLTNIVQTVRIYLSIPRGSLLHHPEVGLLVPAGMSTADLDPLQLAQATREMFAGDSTFSGVTSVAVDKRGPVVSIGVEVGIAGYSKNIPITVDCLR